MDRSQVWSSSSNTPSVRAFNAVVGATTASFKSRTVAHKPFQVPGEAGNRARGSSPGSFRRIIWRTNCSKKKSSTSSRVGLGPASEIAARSARRRRASWWNVRKWILKKARGS